MPSFSLTSLTGNAASSQLTPLTGAAAAVKASDVKLTAFGDIYALAAAELPSEKLSISEDVTLVRHGPMFHFEGKGAGQLTLGMQSVLLRAFEAGASAASDYLKGYSAGHGDPEQRALDNVSRAGSDSDDRLRAHNRSTLDGGRGNDHLMANEHARISGGAGHDYISAFTNARVDGGTGNDFIGVDTVSMVDAGEGQDFVEAGSWSQIKGGAGDDILRTGNYSTISGGQGDDTIRVGRDAVIMFGRGDGVDVIESQGGEPWHRKLAQLTGTPLPNTLNSARIVLGQGIAEGDLNFARHGDDLRIIVNGTDDGLVIRNAALYGVPSLQFPDGSALSGAEIWGRVDG